MIAMAALGVALIFLMAGVVGVLDQLRAASWREVAADRRQSWESRQTLPADGRAAGR